MATKLDSTTRTFQTSAQTPAPELKPLSLKPQLHLKLSTKKLRLALAVVLVLLIAGLAGHYRRSHEQPAPTSPNYFAVETARLGKLIQLPAEKPTIATVKDTSKLTGQTFYKDAHDNDILFVYSSNHKAILYRPSTNMIINVSPVNVTPTTKS